MTIDWEKFKKLIGNGRTKIVQRGKTNYKFVSYNPEEDEVTIQSVKAKYTLRVLPREHFVGDFTLVRMTDEKPLF